MTFSKVTVGFLLWIMVLNVSANDEGCPYPAIYIEFDRSYHECSNGQVRRDASCTEFVRLIPTLFPNYDCRRSFDTGPVPALWLFGAAAEDYIALLYELAVGPKGKFGNDWFVTEQREAKKIFLSPEFRSVLDGHLVEEYFPKIEELRSHAP